MKKKILYGIMFFIGVNIALFIIGCMHGAPLMGILIGWGMLIVGFCIIYPLVKLGE